MFDSVELYDNAHGNFADSIFKRTASVAFRFRGRQI